MKYIEKDQGGLKEVAKGGRWDRFFDGFQSVSSLNLFQSFFLKPFNLFQSY